MDHRGPGTNQAALFTLWRPYESGVRRADCELWQDTRGWEVRLYVGGALHHFSVARTRDACEAHADDWRREMLAQGWRVDAGMGPEQTNV